jgi:hypothetical protein
MGVERSPIKASLGSRPHHSHDAAAAGPVHVAIGAYLRLHIPAQYLHHTQATPYLHNSIPTLR